MTTQKKNTTVFPADHTAFYAKFDDWRKRMDKSDNPTGGVYVLKAGKPVHRLLKADPDGILYIGKGVILPYHNRIGKFVNSLNATEVVHDGGNRFNMDSRVKQKYPLETACIEITLSETPEELEKDMLRNYLNNFGELPPFNRSL